MRTKDGRREAILSIVREHGNLPREEPFVPGKTPVPYGGRVYDEKELVNLVDSALEFWLTAGRYADAFEEGMAKYLGVKHCLLTNSGSSANLLAVFALTSPSLGMARLKPGDEVLTVAAGFPTTVTPILQAGLVPVFVDVALPNYNVDPDLLEEARSRKTRAVMLAHTLGNPFDVDAVKKFCERHALWLIEDNCDALGSRYKGRLTGTFGHIATQSFYPPHHMTMGEGGALFTNDPHLKRIIVSLRDWGRDCWCLPGKDNTCGLRHRQQFGTLPFGYDHKYVFSHLGFNLKVTDLQAAVGCGQLPKLSRFVAARRRNHAFLKEAAGAWERDFVLPEATPGSDPSWFGFLLTVREDAGFTRSEIVDFLERRGIQTRMLFAGNLLRHPCFDAMRKSRRGYRVAGSLANTDAIMERSFWVGVYPGIDARMRAYMARSVGDFLAARRTEPGVRRRPPPARTRGITGRRVP